MDTTTPPSKTSAPSANRKTMKGAEIMVEYLIKEKVPYLFGVCGHGNIGFLDAAAGAADRIKTISVHHEQAAGYMADAYYKVKHQPVATYTSCGPGSCNMPVALAGAMMDSSSFLAITGNVPTTQFNRMPFQETGRYFQGDFPSVIRPLVKKSFQPTRVEMLPLAMKQAFGLLRTGRPGPVNIDVPLNVFQESAEVEVPDPDPLVMQRSPGDLGALDQALDLLLAAKRPTILVGQGGLIGEATDVLLEFLKLLRIPVVTSPNGKGTIDETSQLSFGPIGRNGPYAANEAAREADVLLALGCSFDDRATSAWISGYTLTIPPTKLIQIDNDPSEIGRNYPVHLGILGDIRASLEVLLRRAKKRSNRRRPMTTGWPACAIAKKSGTITRSHSPNLTQRRSAPSVCCRACRKSSRKTRCSPPTLACITTGSCNYGNRAARAICCSRGASLRWASPPAAFSAPSWRNPKARRSQSAETARS